MPKKTRSKKNNRWATQSFHETHRHIHELNEILHLSLTGVERLRAMPRVVEVLEKIRVRLGEDPEDDAAQSREAATRLAELAEREVDRGFPLLHAQATITLWSYTEDLVRTFLATWLRNKPEARHLDEIRKLKISLGEYEALDEDDRCQLIVDLLGSESASKRAVARFESLLEPFGLSGHVDPGIERTVLELYHVRNVLVHRNGLVDSKFVRGCPWLKKRVGDVVQVSHDDFERYLQSVMEYSAELILRVGEHFGIPRDELLAKEESAGADS